MSGLGVNRDLTIKWYRTSRILVFHFSGWLTQWIGNRAIDSFARHE